MKKPACLHMGLKRLVGGANTSCKGGTSLCKAWKLIKRSSEDIDLAVGREFFGFDGELTISQGKLLRKKAGEYIDNQLLPELEQLYKEDVMDAWRINYNTMNEHMIYEKNPSSFNKIIADITKIKNNINALPWQLQFQFPNTNS